MTEATERTGTASQDARLDLVVGEVAPDLSRSRASALIKEGCVRVDGAVVTKPAHKVHAGATVTVEVPPPSPSGVEAQDLPLRIVYEDADLVVIDKDPGMVVHPGAGHPDGTLVNALLHHVDDLSGVGGVERPGLVHRLDRGTSGLLVVAKHDAAHQHLAQQFEVHSANRTYLAIVHGTPRSDHGELETWLARHPRDRVRYASTTPDRGKRAFTRYWVEGRARGIALVRCELETGRTHQIRVHLTELGHALVGDDLYTRRDCKPGAWLRPLIPEGRVMLHAWKLRVRHPRDMSERAWTAPLPDDMLEVLAAADLDPPKGEGGR